MPENYPTPPLLPDHLKGHGDMWIGAMSPYNPQYAVVSGPSNFEIARLAGEHEEFEIELESRSDDMDESEPSDKLGRFTIKIIELFENDDKTLNFLANGKEREALPHSDRRYGGCMWVWYYDSGSGGADILVDD